MKKNKVLIVAAILSLISCSTEDTSSTGENPAAENPGEDPQVKNCDISKITYGFHSGDKVYTAASTGENLTELTSDVDKVVFTYDSNGYLTRKESYETGNSQVQFKAEYTTNSNGKITERRNWEFYSGSLNYTGKDSFNYNGTVLTQITSYDTDDTTMEGKIVYEWTGENPTKLSFYDGKNVLECETTIDYDLTKENKFNAIFPYFAFQDIYDEDFQLYLFLGKNVVTKTTNSCSGSIANYNINLNANGLIDNVKVDGDLVWEFEYECE